MNRRVVARAHGAFNIASGLWPVLNMPTFEAATGPKTDEWLVKAVGGMLVATGLTQLAGAGSAVGRRDARRIGIGAAAALTVVDLVYVPKGRISKVYLLDAALHLAWIGLWLTSSEAGSALA